jgi:putative tryptophan/tyrosine transport system substrate-binding protein
MKPREFISLVGGAVATWPLTAHAQQRSSVPRIGYVFSFTQAEGEQLWQACRQGLRKLGYVEGQNIILEPRWADGLYERLPNIVAELLRIKVDIIVTAATPAIRATMAATKTIPIVIVAVGEPVKGGIVASLVRPGGNVTGLSLSTSDLSGKRLQLLMEVVRKVSRVAVLLNPENPVSAVFLEETQLASRQLGIELQAFEAHRADELERAFVAAAGRRVDALTVFDDPALWSFRAQIVALAAARKIPAMYGVGYAMRGSHRGAGAETGRGDRTDGEQRTGDAEQRGGR